MKKLLLGVVVGLSALLGGCSTVMNGSNDDINVITSEMASCFVDGQEFVAPGVVNVDSSHKDLLIQCETPDKKKKGQSMARASVTTSAIVGNFVLGGIPGWLVDFGTGNAYNYPGYLTVPMKSVE